MSDVRPATSRRAVVAAGLIVLGLVLWGLYRFVASGGPYPSAPDAKAPDSVTLKQGHTYFLAVPGGRSAASATSGFVSVDGLSCRVVTAGGVSRALTVADDGAKATDALGSFVSPVTGPVRVSCTGFSAVFVEGDDSSFDTAGLLLVLATIALVVGVPLLLSTLRTPAR